MPNAVHQRDQRTCVWIAVYCNILSSSTSASEAGRVLGTTMISMLDLLARAPLKGWQRLMLFVISIVGVLTSIVAIASGRWHFGMRVLCLTVLILVGLLLSPIVNVRRWYAKY